MGLRITDIALSGFRNYSSYSLSDLGGLTILVGRNGVGKTNLLEAVQLVTSATSFRHPQIAQLIGDGASGARVQIEATDGNRRITTALSLEPGKKRYTVNGKAKGIVDVKGVLPAVTFTPDDLQLAKKSSSVKRAALDELGSQLARNYHVVLGDYEKTLRYKNRLLKDEAPFDLIAAINETLITCGSQLFCYRVALFSRMLPLLKRIYAEISDGGEGFSAAYLPSWDHLSGIEVVGSALGNSRLAGGPAGGDAAYSCSAESLGEPANHRPPAQAAAPPSGGPPAKWEFETQNSAEGLVTAQPLAVRENGAPDRDAVRELLAENLALRGGEEVARKRGLVGPHNDKIAFFLSSRDASAFASQGQQRSIVLAWKLAEVELVRQSLGTNPVLLLDDVMSELDSARRNTLVNFASEDIQTFITTTDLTGFNPDLLQRARIVELQ